MTAINLKSSVFTALENMLTLPAFIPDYETDLDMIVSGYSAADPTILQLSSSLIRLSQPLWQWQGPDRQIVEYEMQISGSGIGPVSTMDALINAIDQGFATGTLNKFQILRDGTTIAQLTMGASGYVFSTGSLSVTLGGDLPFTFGQMFEFVDLFTSAADIFALTRLERQALFVDLADFSITSLDVTDGATALFGFNVTSSLASLTINGLTFSAFGTFPDNFGEDLELLWQISRQIDLTGTVDFTTLTNFAVTSVQITDGAGHVLASVVAPTDGLPVTWKVDGKLFDQVLMGYMTVDILTGELGATRSVLAGLGGNDDLFGGAATDFLFGGSGNDDLFGGTGADRLIGGSGRDQLAGGLQADTFVFTPGRGLDTITDFVALIDRIEIRTANRLSDLTFTDTGTDVRIDFNGVHIIVEDIGIAALRHVENFLF